MGTIEDNSFTTQFGDDGVGEDPTLAILLPNIDTCLRFVCYYLRMERGAITPLAISVCDPPNIKAKHGRHALVHFIYTNMKTRHELVDFIYAHMKNMMNEDNMTKMVLQQSIMTCMNLDVANKVLKTKLPAELMTNDNLTLFELK